MHGQKDTTMTISVLDIDSVETLFYITFKIDKNENGFRQEISKIWFVKTDTTSRKRLSIGKTVTVLVMAGGPERSHGSGKTIYITDGKYQTRIHRFQLKYIK